MIAVSYHDRVNVLQALPLANAAPFDRPEWYDLLAKEGGLSPVIALAQHGEQSAAVALMRRKDTLEPMANWYNFFWRPLATKGANALPLLTEIARDLAKKQRRITLTQVPDEDGSAELIAQAFRNAGWAVIVENCDTNHILRVEGRSFAKYLSGRPGPLRTTLKRKAGKVDVTVLTHFDAAAWRDYEAVYANSWKPAEGKPAMLRRFAEQEGAAGRLRLGLARVQGRAIAAQFWTVEAHTAWIHKLAHVEEAVKLSAGTVLTAAMFERVIDGDAVEIVDFGTGDDPYKSAWMEELRPRFSIDCHRPRDPRSWPWLMRAALRKLASRPSAG